MDVDYILDVLQYVGTSKQAIVIQQVNTLIDLIRGKETDNAQKDVLSLSLLKYIYQSTDSRGALKVQLNGLKVSEEDRVTSTIEQLLATLNGDAFLKFEVLQASNLGRIQTSVTSFPGLMDYKNYPLFLKVSSIILLIAPLALILILSIVNKPQVNYLYLFTLLTIICYLLTIILLITFVIYNSQRAKHISTRENKLLDYIDNQEKRALKILLTSKSTMPSSEQSSSSSSDKTVNQGQVLLLNLANQPDAMEPLE